MTRPPLDEIRLLGVSGTGRHGVLEHERRDGQVFVVDVVLGLDVRRAARTDTLADTVDYGQVAAGVLARIEGRPCDLIETLADRIAADVLADPRVESVEVTVHKPQAPVGVPFGDVQVVVRRQRGTPVVIALGANLGDPLATLTAAVAALPDVPGLTVTAVAPLVESDPVGGPPDQPPYLNGVVLAGYPGEPAQLLRELHAIEYGHGRVRDVRWGPRTLDLDLIQFGVPGTPRERLSVDPALVLPHARAHERAFVLRPWVSVDPGALVRLGHVVAAPVEPVADVLARLDESGLRPGPQWPV